MIQLGAILAIMVVFFGKIWSTIIHLPTKAEARRFALIIVLAFLPAAVAGVLLGKTIRAMFLDGSVSAAALQIIATVLIMGGFVMLLVERFRPPATTTDMERMPFWKAVLIGCCQAVALIPGVSRHAVWGGAQGGGGVFVLPGDAHDDGGVCLFIVGQPRQP
jgi:undecaprenyl-diphosphatase